jgi:hypothetical protein
MTALVRLSEEARKLAMERFRLLQPHLEQNEPLKSVAKAAGSFPARAVSSLLPVRSPANIGSVSQPSLTSPGNEMVESGRYFMCG